MKAKLLTEPEVAECLLCSTTKVKRLRLSGRLIFIPGRPVLIAESDLTAYMDATKRMVREREAASADASKADTRGDPDARRWALNAIFKAQTSVRRGPK